MKSCKVFSRNAFLAYRCCSCWVFFSPFLTHHDIFHTYMRLNILCVHRRSVNVLLTNPIWVLVTRMQVTSLNAQGKLTKYIFIFLSSLYQKMFANLHLVSVLVSQKSALCSSVTNLSLNKCPLSHNECCSSHSLLFRLKR